MIKHCIHVYIKEIEELSDCIIVLLLSLGASSTTDKHDTQRVSTDNNGLVRIYSGLAWINSGLARIRTDEEYMELKAKMMIQGL